MLLLLFRYQRETHHILIFSYNGLAAWCDRIQAIEPAARNSN
jgi:hypothetical protein